MPEETAPGSAAAPRNGRRSEARRAYAAPEVYEYGSVSKLTAQKSGALSDGTMQMSQCL